MKYRIKDKWGEYVVQGKARFFPFWSTRSISETTNYKDLSDAEQALMSHLKEDQRREETRRVAKASSTHSAKELLPMTSEEPLYTALCLAGEKPAARNEVWLNDKWTEIVEGFYPGLDGDKLALRLVYERWVAWCVDTGIYKYDIRQREFSISAEDLDIMRQKLDEQNVPLEGRWLSLASKHMVEEVDKDILSELARPPPVG